MRAGIVSIFKHKIEIIRKNAYSLFNDSMEARDRQMKWRDINSAQQASRRRANFALQIDQREIDIMIFVDQRNTDIIK
jgi:hypothetical protein